MANRKPNMAVIIIIVLVVIFILMKGDFGFLGSTVGVGCQGSDIYGDCDTVYSLYGSNPSTLYVCGYQTSSCTGDDYSVSVSSEPCASDRTLLNTCTSAVANCNSLGGLCQYSNCIEGYTAVSGGTCDGNNVCCEVTSQGDCYDSDGLNLNVRGTSDAGQEYCVNGEVFEYYCDSDDYLVGTTYPCGAGKICSLGACVEDSTVDDCSNPYGDHGDYWCSLGDIYKCDDSLWDPWTENCGTCKTTTPQTISNSLYVEDTLCEDVTCTSHDYYGCYNNKIYWYDSCDERETVKESCANGCDTGNTACKGGIEICDNEDNDGDSFVDEEGVCDTTDTVCCAFLRTIFCSDVCSGALDRVINPDDDEYSQCPSECKTNIITTKKYKLDGCNCIEDDSGISNEECKESIPDTCLTTPIDSTARQISVTRTKIMDATSTELLDSMCVHTSQCEDDAACISMQALINDGTLTEGDAESRLTRYRVAMDAAGVTIGLGAGALFGVTAIGPYASLCAAIGAGTVGLGFPICLATVAVTGGIIGGIGADYLTDLFEGLGEKDQTKVGYCVEKDDEGVLGIINPCSWGTKLSTELKIPQAQQYGCYVGWGIILLVFVLILRR